MQEEKILPRIKVNPWQGHEANLNESLKWKYARGGEKINQKITKHKNPLQNIRTHSKA